MSVQSPITLLVCALGGEGGGVLAEWLVEVATRAGYPVQSTSIPGVAQRTGATTYYLEFFAQPTSTLGGRRPVFGLVPVAGGLDALVCSELLEAARQVTLGLADAQRTQVITSSARTLTTAERMVLGDGRVDAAQLLALIGAHSRELQVLDFNAMAREAGTVMSAVLFGAIAASGLLPYERAHYEAVIAASGRGADASRRGFDAAFAGVAAARARGRQVGSYVEHVVGAAAPAPAAAPAVPPALPADVAAAYPPSAHAMIALGLARVREYQGDAYAALYLQRLARVRDAERAADPQAAQSFATLREAARWLALWMCFDDIVRVAGLKLAGTRLARVRREVAAGAHDVVKVYDYFKPGVPEFAGLLPAAWGQALLRWDARRRARGLEPWALPLHLPTHTVFGMVMLKLLSSLRWLRRRGQRWADEQALIERWLDAAVRGCALDWRLGHEIVLCGRLIKGYGGTQQRGRDNLVHIIDQLAEKTPFASTATRADAVAQARRAALADEGGKALGLALAQHGAAPLPVREVPIRFVRKANKPTA
ncbi:MAG: indolepyruvate oxidoreductase subunit beta family protein [Ideonella sp.]|nr:indolepyruvate oxidoreductase subunit beta family protein [Ideonella sp.]MCC7459036.1 indolepyruvate oxidoreductase subunit beta family protein [Nitrospira sp.]